MAYEISLTQTSDGAWIWTVYTYSIDTGRQVVADSFEPCRTAVEAAGEAQREIQKPGTALRNYQARNVA